MDTHQSPCENFYFVLFNLGVYIRRKESQFQSVCIIQYIGTLFSPEGVHTFLPQDRANHFLAIIWLISCAHCSVASQIYVSTGADMRTLQSWFIVTRITGLITSSNNLSYQSQSYTGLPFRLLWPLVVVAVQASWMSWGRALLHSPDSFIILHPRQNTTLIRIV